MGRYSTKKKRVQNPKKQLAIIEGLIDFFQTNSLAESNMDTIAEYIGKSKATLYKYFASKEEMVDALIDYKINSIAGFVSILNNDEIPFVERYDESFQLLQQHIGDITNEFLSDLKEVFPVLFEKIELLIQLAVRELANYYKKGMELGEFNQLNAQMLSHMDFVFFRQLTNPDFLKENQLSMQEAFNDFYAIRCQGLIAEK